MEFLTGLFIILILAAIFGPKKRRRKSRRRNAHSATAEAKAAREVQPPKPRPRAKPLTKAEIENERKLIQAMKDGESLTIAYSGGMQPGATRQIFPLKFHGNKVRAQCHSSGSEKDFFIGKITILPPNTPITYQDFESKGSLESIDAFTMHYLGEFESKGWTIHNRPDQIQLFDHFKNGKPRKTPALSLDYSPTYQEYVEGGSDGEMVTKDRLRPWSVTTRQGSSYYRDLKKALIKFLLLEKELSPFRE